MKYGCKCTRDAFKMDLNLISGTTLEVHFSWMLPKWKCISPASTVAAPCEKDTTLDRNEVELL